MDHPLILDPGRLSIRPTILDAGPQSVTRPNVRLPPIGSGPVPRKPGRKAPLDRGHVEGTGIAGTHPLHLPELPSRGDGAE